MKVSNLAVNEFFSFFSFCFNPVSFQLLLKINPVYSVLIMHVAI